MLASEIYVEAQVQYRPESQHMTISFSGSAHTGMPPFSNELMNLARGALRVTFDLRGLRLANPKRTVEAILAALGTDESDPNTEILTSDPVDNALRGAYYAG